MGGVEILRSLSNTMVHGRLFLKISIKIKYHTILFLCKEQSTIKIYLKYLKIFNVISI